MGHKFGHEFWKHQRSAAMRRISRSDFLDEFNDVSSLRVESGPTNAKHIGEALDHTYFGHGMGAYYDWLFHFRGR